MSAVTYDMLYRHFPWAIANHLPVQLDEGAFMPERAHSTDAGLDLRSPIGVSLLPLHGIGIRTGIHIQLPPRTVGMLKSKSGLNTKFGITSLTLSISSAATR